MGNYATWYCPCVEAFGQELAHDSKYSRQDLRNISRIVMVYEALSHQGNDDSPDHRPVISQALSILLEPESPYNGPGRYYLYFIFFMI